MIAYSCNYGENFSLKIASLAPRQYTLLFRINHLNHLWVAGERRKIQRKNRENVRFTTERDEIKNVLYIVYNKKKKRKRKAVVEEGRKRKKTTTKKRRDKDDTFA